MKKPEIVFILVSVMFLFSSCSYDERSIYVENNIKKRIIIKENSQYTLKKFKEVEYIDFFNSEGRLAKREIPDGYKYSAFEYDSSGNKVLMKSIYNDGVEIGYHYYEYDTMNNLVAEGIGTHPEKKYKNIYSDNKLAAVFIYNYKNALREVRVFKYDWKGHLKEELHIKNTDYSNLVKLSYNYDLSGRLKEKTIYKARLKSKPSFSENSIKIYNQNYPPEFYKLQYIIKYVYNDLDLVSTEIKLSPTGYELEKTFYEYFTQN